MDIDEGAVYIATADALPPRPSASTPSSLVIIGKPTPRYLDGTRSVLWTEDEVSVMTLLLRLQRIFHRYQVWEDDMQHIIDENLPVRKLGEISMQFVRNPIYFQGASFKVLFHLVDPSILEDTERFERYKESYDGVVPVPDNTYLSIEDINVLISDPEYNEAIKASGPTYYSGSTYSFFPMLFLNIGDTEENYVARLAFDEVQHTFTDKDYAILQILGTFMSKAIRGKNVDLFNRPRDLDYVLENLLGHHLIEEHRIDSVLRGYQWHIDDAYFCTALEPQSEDHSKNTLSALAPMLMTRLPSECYIAFKEQIVFVFNLTQIQLSREEVLQRAIPILRDNLLVAGISYVFRDFKNLYYYYNQAKRALELGQEKNPTFWYYRYDDYHLDDLIIRCKGKQIVSALCPEGLTRLIEYDQRKSTGYVNLLRSYLNHEMNIAETIRAEYIHRNTFLYRLERIKEITRLDLTNPDVRLELEIAFKVIEMEGERPSGARTSRL